jgi:predicted deacylase
MRARVLAAATAAASVVAVSSALVTSSSADPTTTPNGPWPATEMENLNAIYSYEQLWSTLESIQRRASGAFELEAAPLQSSTGRDIPVVTVGDGPTSVMFIANQHGDEFVVSTAMVEVIRAISGNSNVAQDIRDELTVTVVPRVNVDGFDADIVDLEGNTPPWRQNFDVTCEAFCEFYEEGRGYDINRYHSYFESAFDHPYQPGTDTNNPVSEAVAMRLLWDERQPEFVVDFHHQGTYVDGDGRMISSSVMWPNAEEEAARLGISEEFAETVTLSKRVVSEMLVNLEQYGHANVTRYPSTTFPGIARNAYGLLGSGSVLYEARGDIGQQSKGYIAKQAYIAGMSILTAAADGSLFTRSTEPADNIRERGDSVPNPHE